MDKNAGKITGYKTPKLEMANL